MQRISQTTRALTRPLSAAFQQALRKEAVHLDIDRALRQHEDYEDALRQVVPVTAVEDAPSMPDASFVEDTAVMLNGSEALIGRFRVPSRQGEQEGVRVVLRGLGITMHELDNGATLDGGDVLSIGDFIFVGQTARTNRGGLLGIAKAAGQRLRAEGVTIDNLALHLKSICSKLDEETIVVWDKAEKILRGQVEAFAPGVFRWVVVPDFASANVLRVNECVFVPKGFDVSTRVLAGAVGSNGEIIELETSELRKADGALTCGSILIPE